MTSRTYNFRVERQLSLLKLLRQSSLTVERAVWLLEGRVVLWKSNLAAEVHCAGFQTHLTVDQDAHFSSQAVWPWHLVRWECLFVTRATWIPVHIHINPLFISGWLGYLDTLFSHGYNTGVGLCFHFSSARDMSWDKALSKLFSCSFADDHHLDVLVLHQRSMWLWVWIWTTTRLTCRASWPSCAGASGGLWCHLECARKLPDHWIWSFWVSKLWSGFLYKTVDG